MKFAVAVALPVAVSSAVLETRQFRGGASTSIKLFDTRSEKPLLNKNAKRTFYRFGPLNLKPGGKGRTGFSMDPNGQSFMVNVARGTFCKGCTILQGRASLEYQDGTVADVSKGVYIHHIIAFNDQKKTRPFINQCDSKASFSSIKVPTNPGMTGFIGVSDDNGNEPIYYTTRDGSVNYGYHLAANQSININLDLVNYKKEAQKIFLVYDLETVDGVVGTNSQGALISVTGCGARGLKVAATGATNTTSNKFYFYRDGTIVNAKGHLHDGGVQMDMFINGKYVCSSKAVYGGKTGTLTDKEGKTWETISEMTGCPGPIPVKKGDYMTMVAEYDLKKHPLRKTATGGMAETMGMLNLIFSGN